jgi:hypothetical protein
MNIPTTNRHVYNETDIQQAISAYKAGQFRSVRSTAIAFSIPSTTLHNRMVGRKTRQKSYEHAQNLSDTEEKSLVKQITRLTKTGFPASPALVIEMAEFVRARRVVLSKSDSLSSSLMYRLGKNWLQRFRTRNPEIQSVFTRQIENARLSGANFEVVQQWFNAITDIRIEY